MNISRRNFLKGGAAAGALAALSNVSIAAAEAAKTYADTIKWDAEYDVVVMGMGIAGMAAAKTAADDGARVLIAEKMSENLAGGNSKVAGQLFAFANHDVEAAKAYYTALAAGRPVPEAMTDVMCEAIANMDNILADEFGFNKDEYMDWTGINLGVVGATQMGAMSPEYPEMPCSDKIGLWTTHPGASDSYMFLGFKQNVLDRADKIDVWYESPAVKILQDPQSKIVVGIVVERGGVKMNVRALNGVVLATGGFEANPDMVQQYLGFVNYAPRGGQYNTGDGIKMAQDIGADLWHMSCFEGLFGLGGVTFPTEIGTPCAMISTLAQDACNTGACILVGTDGNRFLNESEIVRHGHLYENGVWENPTFPEKTYVLYDEKQFAAVKESGAWTEAQLAQVVEFANVDELCAATGMKPECLKATIANFNTFAETGVDYKCGRGAQFMRAFEGDKIYCLYVVQGLLNTQGGPRRNENAEVMDVCGNPIPHLYSAGECGGITACMYQGGTNLAECITFGRIAGHNAAAAKEELPAYAAGEAVESNPAKPGEITDLGAVKEYDTAEDEVVGSAQGMMGDVTARVKTADGKIASVEIIDHAETPGIGTNAIDALPGQMTGLSTAEEIDAVDNVSGATITSKAIKAAVKTALGL